VLLNYTAHRQALLWAFISVLLFAGFEQLTVARNFHGNWTALFCTGARQAVPPSLESGTWRVHDAEGFDGQMYRYLAHDPLLTGEAHRYVDNFGLRARRILVPALAWLLALGRPGFIDAAYIALFWVACFAGTYYTARVALARGAPAWWSLIFLALPASLIAADRLIVDMPLCAITAALAWYASQDRPRTTALLLAMACLCRETGFVLLAAFVLAELLRRNYKRVIWYATAGTPALAWYLYVHTRPEAAAQSLGTSVPDWLGSVSRIGPVLYLLHPVSYPFLPPINALTQSLDRIAILGMLGGFALGIWYWRTSPKLALPLTALFFALSSFATVGPPMWETIYNIARPYSPLLLLLALHGYGTATSRRWVWLLPIVMIDMRILLQLTPQFLGILGAGAGYAK
jgi:hypothetical protein